MPKVLVIDDDPVIVELLRVNFQIEGFEVIAAADGMDGLQRVWNDHPDVVLCDIMMPRLDGLALLKRLRGDSRTSTLPVILLSARAQGVEIEAGMEAGADDYITKPFDPFELIDRVYAVLAQARR